MSGSNEGEKGKGKVVRLDFQKARKEREEQEAAADPWAEQKLQAFGRLIEEGMVLVNLDARRPGVHAPGQHGGDPQLGLNFSHRFYAPDFVYDLEGVRASLSFRGEPFFCDIPWSAVFMMRSHVTDEVFLFPTSVPPELEDMLRRIEAQLEEQQKGGEGRADEAPPEASLRRAGFEPHDPDGEDDPDPSDGSGPDDEPPDGGPHLKLVKG
jgi:hypothetical protein